MEQRSAVAREAASKQLEDGLKARKEMLHLINETARRVNETKIAEMELGPFSKFMISHWFSDKVMRPIYTGGHFNFTHTWVKDILVKIKRPPL